MPSSWPPQATSRGSAVPEGTSVGYFSESHIPTLSWLTFTQAGCGPTSASQCPWPVPREGCCKEINCSGRSPATGQSWYLAETRAWSGVPYGAAQGRRPPGRGHLHGIIVNQAA